MLLGNGGAGKIFEHRTNLALHRMFGPKVFAVIDAHGAGDAQEARMLAGAIVVQGRRLPGARHGRRRGLRNRPMRAATQRGRIETGFRQHAFNAGNMRRFAAVRGASERQLFVVEPVTIRHPLLDERQGLQCLDRGTRKYRHRHVADSKRHCSRGVGNRDGPAVPAFDQQASHDFDQNGIGHVSLARFTPFSISGKSGQTFMDAQAPGRPA